MENLGGFLGSLMSGAFGLIGQGLNYKHQSALADKQNQFNLDMWRMNNEYNSPQAQMKRFEEAGLNPALMYGQGSAGLSSSPPVQSVPDAPNYSKDLEELGKSFNIENLKTVIANRKKAQAEAKSAQAAADDAESDNEALRDLYWNYTFDPATGQFVFDGGISKDSNGNISSKPVYPSVSKMASAKVMRILSDNYRTNSLLVPRGKLIGSQTNLNAQRNALLAPQIRYWNFNSTPWRMKTNFWIGNVKNGVQAISPFF
jgi:hypothetical protein